eukprot:3926502-Alexandrium_andersonii.AAC.1
MPGPRKGGQRQRGTEQRGAASWRTFSSGSEHAGRPRSSAGRGQWPRGRGSCCGPPPGRQREAL